MNKTPYCTRLIILFFVIFSLFTIFSPISHVNFAHAADKYFLRGQKLFKKCIHCHTYKVAQTHRIGPNLYGMFGRKAGKVVNFDFSEAWKNANFIWTEKTLDNYLLDPHKMIPNNQMPFDGLSSASDRKALIIYLKKIVQP